MIRQCLIKAYELYTDETFLTVCCKFIEKSHRFLSSKCVENEGDWVSFPSRDRLTEGLKMPLSGAAPRKSHGLI
jgi:hypothetical protein